MENNIFFKEKKELRLENYMDYDKNNRGNLGEDVPVAVYRLLEFSMKEELIEQVGKEKQIEIFRKAGYRSGIYFAENMLDLSLEFDAFIAQLQLKVQEMKIGVLRIEKVDQDTGKIILTVAEDADCSGLPLLGETVCNYDEGFLSGILDSYTGKKYKVIEVDCWATGDRVCRFHADVME